MALKHPIADGFTPAPASNRTGGPELPWDGFDAYLFDIDGTLLRCRDRLHSSAFGEGLLRATGLAATLDGIPVHGNTDLAILEELLRKREISSEDAAELVPQVLLHMRQLIFAAQQHLVVYPMPGVFRTLDHLRHLDRLLGLGTGNLEEIGWLKTEICGLRDYFTFGVFCDRFAQRAAMIAHGAEQARTLAGSQATLCVVGDTPSDIAAARHNGLAVIAVATGVFPLAELQACGPQFAVPTLHHLFPALPGASQ